MRIRVFLMVLALSIAIGMSGQSVSISPNPQITILQQNFVEYVRLDTATQIRGCTVWLDYDPTEITFVSAARGSIFNGFSNFWWQCIQESTTRTRIECIIMGAGLFVNGPGNLLNVTYRAVAGEYSSIQISNIELYDILGYVIPGTVTQDGDIIIGSQPAYAKIKCWLQGPYANGAMLTGQHDYIPLTSPYSADPATVAAIPADVVDWALMELRSAYNGQPVLSKSLWLGSDGYLRSPGKPYVIMMQTSPGPYYVVLRHRNHLAVMSATPFQFASTGTPPELDLTLLANIYGNGGVAQVASGVVAMIAGDADQSGAVLPSDRNQFWRVQAGLSGYLNADFNLDGNVLPSDLNGYWRVNSGLLTQVPNSR